MKMYNAIQNGDTVMHFLDQNLKIKKRWTITTQKYHEWNLQYAALYITSHLCGDMPVEKDSLASATP